MLTELGLTELEKESLTPEFIEKELTELMFEVTDFEFTEL